MATVVELPPDPDLEIVGAERLVGAQRSSLGATLAGAWRARRTRVGLVLAGVFVLIGLFGPIVAPHSPTAFVGTPFHGPDSHALLGTDELGRDVLSRILAGGRAIIAISAIATIVGVGLGALLGASAAYAPTRIDEAIMRPLDVVLSFPQLILALLFVSVLGPHAWLIALTIAVAHAPPVARVARGAALAVRDLEFVQFTEALGVGRARIISFELIPNISSPLLVELGLRLTYSIGLVASLNFIGFGTQPPAPNWGQMINENREGMLAQPLAVVAPVVVIALLTVGVNLITDGLARASVGIERSGGALE
jgi:peptide/nickel transport system permease protein